MLAGGITLNIQVCGRGPAVLPVHGFPDTSDLRCHQVPATGHQPKGDSDRLMGGS